MESFSVRVHQAGGRERRKDEFGRGLEQPLNVF